MEQLAEVDTTGVEPMAHVHEVRCPLRPDEPRPSLGSKVATAAAPEREDTSFVVPRIIEEG